MTKREELKNRAKRAILEKALFRWENATVISTALLLSVFDGLFELIPFTPWWVWAIGGTLGTGALIYSSLTDPKLAARAVADVLRDEFHPKRLKNKRLQKKVREALDYHKRLNRAIQEREDDSLMADEMRQVLAKMDEWIEEIYGLAQRLDHYQREARVFQQNKQRAELQLKSMDQRLVLETNPKVRQEIQNNIDNLHYQLKALAAVEDTMQRAELLLDNKLTAMGTIYIQSTLASVKEIDSGRAQRLRHEIAEEVQEMDDILQAMDEVYASSAQF